MGRAKTTVEPPPPLMCLVERIEHEDAKILSGATHQSNKDLARRARRRRRRRKFCIVLIVFVVFYLDVGRLFALDNQTGGISNSSKRQDYLAVGELSPERADNLNRDIIQADSLKVQNQSDPSRGGPPPPVVWDQQGKSGKEITTADQAVDTSSSPDGVSGGGGGQDSDSVISSSEIATNPLSAGGGGGEEVAHQNTPATASASITAEEANAVESPRNDHDDVPTSNKPDAPEAALKLFPDINTTQPAVATTNTTTAGELLVQGLEREQQRQQRQRAWLEDKIPFTDAAAAGDGGSDQDNHGHNSGGGGELESVSQRASRLLLQLLVLGFFILLSSSLIVVYSIKFCVCQRRKERRLLRRALIGDISSSRCSQQHLQPAMGAAADPHHYHFSQAQLLALRNSSQPIHTISAAASAATNHHNHHLVPSTLSASSSPLSATIDDQHTIECACPQWRRLPAALANSQQDDYHHHHSHHHQLEFGGTRQQNARFFDNSSAVLQTEPIISTGQPQLVLALLNRLQQLLAGETLAPARATPLSASSSQLLSHQQMVAHLQSQLSQPSCGCQHLDPQHLMLASLSARPPAYSELFLIGSTGNVCAEPATTVAAAGEAAPETATTIERQSEAEMRQQQSQQRQLDQARGSLDNVGTPG